MARLRRGPRLGIPGGPASAWPSFYIIGGSGWRWGLVRLSVGYVLSESGSPGPVGVDQVWAAFWLGLIYGVIDTLLLTVLPVHVVFCVGQQRGWLQRWPGWVRTAVLSLIASMIVTVAYHLGFPEFRGPEVLQPVIGNTVFTLAFVLSGSPLAPLIGHVALHVAAVIHAYGSSVPLPPHYG